MCRLYFAAIGFLLSSLVLNSPALANFSDRLLVYNFKMFSNPAPAPNMELRDLRGRTVTISALKGKVVILNFWRIDCPPCSAEKPILEKIRQKYAGNGLEIVAVNLVDKAEDVEKYVQKNGYLFTFATDPLKRVSLRSHSTGNIPTTFVISGNEAIYEVPGLPTTYVIDRTGKVIGNSVGMVNWEEEPFDELLRGLLNQPGVTVQQANFSVPATHRSGGREQLTENPVSGQGVTSRQDTIPKNRNSSALLIAQGILPDVGSAPAPVPQSQTVAPARKKNSATETVGQDLRKPRPYKPQTQAPAGQKPARPAPPVGIPQAGISNPTVSGSGSLPPLPPAMPYNPQGQRQPVPVIPDESGSVTAQIPSTDSGNLVYPPRETGLPPAQQMPAKNDFQGFILDAFNPNQSSPKPIPIRTPASGPVTQDPETARPAGSFLEQVGRDINNLGTGIKSVFGYRNK